MKVTVLYGTETGNAEMCADSVATHLRDTAEVVVHDMADVDAAVMDDGDIFVLVTSTFGEGELPAGAEALFDALLKAPPDLSGVQFAVFGLGDSYYDGTFNRGGHIVSEHLLTLGATRIGDVGCYDTSSGEPPEDHALQWVRELPLFDRV
ncbi:flavodoxin domain-containing protein [Nocardioides sp. YJ-D4]